MMHGQNHIKFKCTNLFGSSAPSLLFSNRFFCVKSRHPGYEESIHPAPSLPSLRGFCWYTLWVRIFTGRQWQDCWQSYLWRH